MLKDLLQKLESLATAKVDKRSLTSDVAEHFGWRFLKGVEALTAQTVWTLAIDADKEGVTVLSSDKYTKLAEQQRAALAPMENMPFGGLLLSTQKFAVGKHLGQDCFVFPDSSGDKEDSTEGLNIVVLRPKPCDLGLVVYPESWTSRIGKRFFKMQDVVVGQPRFDKHFIVKAADVEGARRLLSRPEIANAFEPFMEKGVPEITVNDVAVRGRLLYGCRVQGGVKIPPYPSTAITLIENLAALSAALELTPRY